MSAGIRRLCAAAALALAAGRVPAREAAASPAAATEASPRVAAVDLVLPPGEPDSGLAELVSVSQGELLSMRAVRRTVQLLYQTGRFRNVVVRTHPVPAPASGPGSWVRLEVTCLPLRVLSALQLHAAEPRVLSDDALRESTGLAANAPLDDADVAAAVDRVRAALARRGWRDAEVQATVRGERLATLDLTVRPGAPTRIHGLRLAGDAGPGAERLLEGLKLRAGAVLDQDALAADARALRERLEAAGYRRARVGTPEVTVQDGAAEVVFPVEAGPLVRFVFRGAAAVEPAVLERQLGLEPGQPVDAPAVDAAVERLLAFYRARGYADVRIEPAEVRRGGVLAIVFHVTEGDRYQLGAIRIEGVAQRTPAAVRTRLLALLDGEDETAPETPEADAARALLISVPGAKTRPAPPDAVAPRARWDAAAWERAAAGVVDDYRVDGYLEAAYLGSTTTLDRVRRVVDATVRFREGPRTSVESIAFQGNGSVSLAELVRETRLAPGEPLSFARIEETRVALLRLYLARGHVYARVEAHEDVDKVRQTAVVRFVIDEGPLVRIGRIVVNGNRRTREEVVRRALAIREGDVYRPEAIARSQAALLRLNVFRSVGLRIQDAEVPAETKDLAVEVSERPWQTLSQSVGFSYADGPRSVLEYGLPNVGGRALELTARAKVNYPIESSLRDRLDERCRSDAAARGVTGEALANTECAWWDVVEGRADVGLRNPRVDLFPVPAALRTDLIGERLHRKAYDLTRLSGIAGVDLSLTERIALTLQYEAEIDDIAKLGGSTYLTQADVERLRFDDGITTLHSIRPSIALDYRDNAAHPHRGWFASATAEYAHSLGTAGGALLFGLKGSDVHANFVKTQGTLSGYLPATPGAVLALSVRGGRIFALDDRSVTIIPKRFFLGGASTMRGYGEDEMVQQDVRPVLAQEARHCATSLTDLGCTAAGREIVDGKLPTAAGGQVFLLVKSELRLQLRGSLEAGLFADLGNLWYDPGAYRTLDLRANLGFGLRFATPIGPAALDFGFNVSPDEDVNERLFEPHFSIGLF